MKKQAGRSSLVPVTWKEAVPAFDQRAALEKPAHTLLRPVIASSIRSAQVSPLGLFVKGNGNLMQGPRLVRILLSVGEPNSQLSLPEMVFRASHSCTSCAGDLILKK